MSKENNKYKHFKKEKIMKTATFVFDGKEFEIQPSVSGDYCHVFLDGELFLEGDPGCEDYYGEPAELVDWFKEMFEDEMKYDPEVWASRFAKDEEEEEDEE